jgi:hypothetical protein
MQMISRCKTIRIKVIFMLIYSVYKIIRTYLKIKSYRRKPVSSDFSVLNWQFVMLCFYIIKRQSHWIPEPAPYSIRGQARNDKRTQKTYFEIGYSHSHIKSLSCICHYIHCIVFIHHKPNCSERFRSSRNDKWRATVHEYSTYHLKLPPRFPPDISLPLSLSLSP